MSGLVPPSFPLPSGCPGVSRKLELNSGTSDPHLHSTSSHECPNTLAFRYASTPAPARSSLASTRQLTMMSGGRLRPAFAGTSSPGPPACARDTASRAGPPQAWPPYIARGRGCGRPSAQAPRIETRNSLRARKEPQWPRLHAAAHLGCICARGSRPSTSSA